jgi:hypothetical protein
VFINGPVCLDGMGCGRWSPLNRCTTEAHTKCVTQALLVTTKVNGARWSPPKKVNEESVTTFDHIRAERLDMYVPYLPPPLV